MSDTKKDSRRSLTPANGLTDKPSISSKSELEGILELALKRHTLNMPNHFIKGDAQAKLLDLALSCLPEPIEDKYCDSVIDTIEQKIKERFS